LGEISPDFDLKNMISTYTKDFPWKKWAKIRQFIYFLNSKPIDFNAKFHPHNYHIGTRYVLLMPCHGIHEMEILPIACHVMA
jgi:hypothetical protein